VDIKTKYVVESRHQKAGQNNLLVANKSFEIWGCVGTGRRKWREAGEGCIMRSFIKLYTSPNVIRVIKLRRMRRAGHVA
jgi:hypothetical protein